LVQNHSLLPEKSPDIIIFYILTAEGDDARILLLSTTDETTYRGFERRVAESEILKANINDLALQVYETTRREMHPTLTFLEIVSGENNVKWPHLIIETEPRQLPLNASPYGEQMLAETKTTQSSKNVLIDTGKAGDAMRLVLADNISGTAAKHTPAVKSPTSGIQPS